jgi:hypothetical protein
MSRFIKWAMVFAGVLTCTMLYAAVAPQAALRSSFGASLEGPLADIIVRSWGVLVGIVGLMLVYGAFHTPVRRVALLVAVVSKLFFVVLILTIGRQFLATGAGVPVAVDSVMVLVFGGYLLAGPR